MRFCGSLGCGVHLHCNRTKGDLSLLTRGYCADLQLPEGPERMKCYKKLCSMDHRKGSWSTLGSTLGSTHARCGGSDGASFVALVRRLMSGFWKSQTLAPVDCGVRPGPRVFSLSRLPRGCGYAGTGRCLEQCRDPAPSCPPTLGELDFSWLARFLNAAVGKPAASQSSPMFRLPSHPSRAGRAKPDSWPPGLAVLAAPILQRIPFVEGSPGSCLFLPTPAPAAHSLPTHLRTPLSLL